MISSGFEIRGGPSRAGSRAVWVIGTLLIAVLLIAGCGRNDDGKVTYHCPMHPTYLADRPGDCPICNMRLVPVDKPADGDTPGARQSEAPDSDSETPARAGTSAAAPREGPALYACPMHPEETSDQPGARCSQCGMDLELVATSSPPTEEASRRSPDHLPVTVEPEGMRLAGLRTVQAKRDTVHRVIRTVGSVTSDETLHHRVQTKVSGWVEKLHLGFAGQAVRRGDPILSIYAPELLSNQEEFLSTRETAARLADSSSPEARRSSQELVNSSRRRLELLDVPESAIAELERTGEISRTVTLLAPASGFVSSKEVVAGQRVEPGMELFTVTDLSRVWIEANFYESEAPAIHLGQKAVVSLPYQKGVLLEGTVAFIHPFLDAETRTLKVRFEFPNHDLSLRPGMFANVELAVESVRGITVPADAVMETGERSLVFVETASGTFEPRTVVVGVRSRERTLILSGIQEGESVVVKANFLLDSESRMRASIAGMSAETPGAPAGGHKHGAGGQ